MSSSVRHFRKVVQAKHVPDAVFLGAVDAVVRAKGCGWALIWDLEEAMPAVPPKVIYAKARRLIHRGLLAGCDCGGCRGDWELTDEGRALL